MCLQSKPLLLCFPPIKAIRSGRWHRHRKVKELFQIHSTGQWQAETRSKAPSPGPTLQVPSHVFDPVPEGWRGQLAQDAPSLGREAASSSKRV